MDKNYTILRTLRVVLDSEKPVSVEQVQEITGFRERSVQRHFSALKDLGFVKRIGKSGQNGYRYKATPSSGG